MTISPMEMGLGNKELSCLRNFENLPLQNSVLLGTILSHDLKIKSNVKNITVQSNLFFTNNLADGLIYIL